MTVLLIAYLTTVSGQTNSEYFTVLVSVSTSTVRRLCTHYQMKIFMVV